MDTIAQNYLSPSQAARALGVTPEWARLLAKAGKLKGTQTPLGWLLDKADVGRLAQERASAARAQGVPQA